MRPRRCSMHGVEGGAVAVAVEGVDEVEPAAAGPSRAPRLRPSWLSISGLTKIRSRRHVPVEHDVARAGQRQRPALGVGDEAVREGAAREGVLHHREADQHDDQHEAADQRRLHEVVAELAGDGEAGGRHPDERAAARSGSA